MTDEITRNAQIDIENVSSRVADSRDRSVIYLKNTSPGTQVITIVLGRYIAVANEGIPLDPGELVIDSDSENYKCFRGVITAISSAAGGKLSVFER